MTEKLQQQSHDGDRAQSLYDDPMVQQALESIENTVLEAIKSSAADEAEVRERAYIMYRLHQNFKQQFLNAMRTGEAAKKELLRIRDPNRFMRMVNAK